MTNRPRVLWIEDSARYELSELAGPVYFSRKYTLTLAEDAASAIYQVMNTSFDVLIVDMRIPPGNHPAWESLYKKDGKVKGTPKLGLHLLEWLLLPADQNPYLSVFGPPPEWVKPALIAVFTVENLDQIAATLEILGIKTYKKKRPPAGIPHCSILLKKSAPTGPIQCCKEKKAAHG
jgi:hypothetical protein